MECVGGNWGLGIATVFPPSLSCGAPAPSHLRTDSLSIRVIKCVYSIVLSCFFSAIVYSFDSCQVGSTNMNEKSSRSHAVFIIIAEQSHTT